MEIIDYDWLPVEVFTDKANVPTFQTSTVPQAHSLTPQWLNKPKGSLLTLGNSPEEELGHEYQIKIG